MQLDPLLYDGVRKSLSTSTFNRFHYENLKLSLKQSENRKNFQGIYRKLFYGISIHRRAPSTIVYLILRLVEVFLFIFIVPCLWSKSLKTTAKMVHFDKLQICKPQFSEKFPWCFLEICFHGRGKQIFFVVTSVPNQLCASNTSAGMQWHIWLNGNIVY